MADVPVHPNILFIITDQQRFDALSCHDGWIRTPNLDRLASEGADLRGHFAQAPVCVPSRCSLFSARYPHAHGVLENDRRLGPHEVHLFKVLRQQGYCLTYTGKNHLLPEVEMELNFDHFEDMERLPNRVPQREAYVALERESQERLAMVGSYASGMFHDFPDEVTTTGMIAGQVRNHLANFPANRPWCAVASFSDPHVPHLAPRRFAAMYPPDSIKLPEFDPAELETKHRRVRVKRGAQGADRATDAERRFYLSVYGAMCTYVDEQIGRILGALRARPDAERTMVVFVSDHGDFGWHHGLCKKDLLLYDDLLHVPAILHWPRAIPPRVVKDALSEHVDVMPTLLELAGIAVPAGCQGRSLVGLIKGDVAVHRSQIHAEVCYPSMHSSFETPEEFRSAWQAARVAGTKLGQAAPFNVPGDHTRCIRTKRWKYIWYHGGFEELYDLERDPGEAHSLAGSMGFEPILSEMRQLLKEWQEDTAGGMREVHSEYPRWIHLPAVAAPSGQDRAG